MEFRTDEAWLTCQPRHWQKAAYPIVVGAIQDGTKGVVQAIMGAGALPRYPRTRSSS